MKNFKEMIEVVNESKDYIKVSSKDYDEALEILEDAFNGEFKDRSNKFIFESLDVAIEAYLVFQENKIKIEDTSIDEDEL